MKKYILFFIISVIISSCAEKEISIPKNVLKQKEMTSILTDIHIAQSAINNKVRNDTTSYTLNDYLIFILKEHKTQKKDFLISLKFYSDHPEILQQVNDSVLTSLNRLEAGTEN